MRRSKIGRLVSSQAPVLAVAAAALIGLVLLQSSAATSEGGAVKANRYIGVAKCKNCHKKEEAGNQYAKWEGMKHSKAYEVLAGDDAKAIGKKLGIADPQKSDECLKCHVTAFGAAKEEIKKGFKIEAGVQCETCHGPGEAHMKARFMAAATAGDNPPAYTKPPEGEIDATPGQETCRKCHNAEGPTFEGFCFYKSVAKIRHLNPLKPRTDEERAALLVCGCGDDCSCSDCCEPGKCGVPPK